MTTAHNTVAAFDRRSFFEQTLAYGVAHSILTEGALNKIRADGGKGLVQIANFFGTAHLMANLESASVRMCHLISLYLESQSEGDLRQAAISLRDHSLLSHSKGGSEMLKHLNAMPVSTFLLTQTTSLEEEKSFLNERSFAAPMSAREYKEAIHSREQIQNTIDFAKWAARQMRADLDDYAIHSAEELIYSAMLVWYAGQTPYALPTEASFVKVLLEIRKKGFKPQRIEHVLDTVPDRLQDAAHAMHQRFTEIVWPAVCSRQIKPVAFIHGDHIGIFCFRTDLDEDVGELDKLVSKEWMRLTKGQQEPEVITTIFLSVATGQAPKTALLKREAMNMVAQLRETGFDSARVLEFIAVHVPYNQQEEMTELWSEDILPNAQLYLADPKQNDTHMERAMEYMRQTCAAKWKGR